MKTQVQSKDISEELVCKIVEDYWTALEMLNRMHGTKPIKQYPPTPCDQLVALGYPYKLARHKLERMQERGILEYLVTPCVPGPKVDRSMISAH